MSDARWGDPREYGERHGGDERPRVYDERDGKTGFRIYAVGARGGGGGGRSGPRPRGMEEFL